MGGSHDGTSSIDLVGFVSKTWASFVSDSDSENWRDAYSPADPEDLCLRLRTNGVESWRKLESISSIKMRRLCMIDRPCSVLLNSEAAATDPHFIQ